MPVEFENVKRALVFRTMSLVLEPVSLSPGGSFHVELDGEEFPGWLVPEKDLHLLPALVEKWGRKWVHFAPEAWRETADVPAGP